MSHHCHPHHHGHHDSCCKEKPAPSPGKDSCCPVQNAVGDGKAAFYEALHAVKVDMLKEKIRAEMGDSLDQGTDAIIKTMRAELGAILAKAGAECELKETIRSIIRAEFGSGK